MRLRNKILIAFLVISLPLVAINAWWIAGQQTRERQRVLDRLHQDAEDASVLVQVFLAELADRGQQTAAHMPADQRVQAYLRDRLAYLRFWNSGITGLAWADPEGEVLLGAPGTLFQKGVRIAGREAVQGLRGDRGWALDELVVEEAGGRPLEILRMVVRDGKGTSRGVLGIRMTPEIFRPLFPSERRFSRIRLADQTGRLVYATDQAEPTLDDRYAWAETPGLRGILGSGGATAPMSPMSADRKRTELMLAHVSVAGTGWVASAVIPEAEAMWESRRTLYGQVAIQVLLVALCAGAALTLANRVTLPARRLADAARRIAAGDRAARAGIQGQGELATLGRAFDEMAEALESSMQAVSEQRDAADNEARLKGLLLDELNHRVRNNLALIVSFMELQRATPAGRLAAAMLDDAIGRVKGLALIHNVLGGASFQAGQYGVLVRRLAEQTLPHGPPAGRLRLLVEEEPLRLPSKALTALGIITNELFTNIAKHAFPDGRDGIVEVSVALAGPEVVIRVRDNGVQLPSGFAEGAGQLGLRLIRSLVEVSLQGTFTLESDEGTTAVIRFPRPDDGAPDTAPQYGESGGSNGKGRVAFEQREEV